MTPPTEEMFPRVLFLTNEPPQNGGAGGIFFHRLFCDYPRQRLQVITNARIDAADQTLACTYSRVRLPMDRLDRTRFWQWKQALRALGATELVPLQRIEAAARNFAPDLVATLMQDSWMYDLAARFARRTRLPLVLFVHDLPSGFEPVPRLLRAAQQRRDAAIYRQAAQRLCVSSSMVEYFTRTFGVGGNVLLPPRADHGPSQSPNACRRLKQAGVLTLGYAGGLHYGYGEQLLRLLPALRQSQIRVEMFGSMPGGVVRELRDAPDTFRLNGRSATPEAAWQSLIDRCDAVLQPYLNPPGPHSLQYQTHFPSKLGDCLGLGLPLLVTGPVDASGVAWCLAHPGTALVVTDPDISAFRTAVNRLRDDAALRTSLASAAAYAAREFDVGEARHKMYAALRFAVNR